MSCARAAANSYPPAPDCALEWCTSASEAVHTSRGEQLPPHSELRARAVTPSVPEKLRAKAGCAACIYFCETAAAAFGAALSSYSDAAQASVKGLAKFARKIVVEIPSQKML